MTILTLDRLLMVKCFPNQKMVWLCTLVKYGNKIMSHFDSNIIVVEYLHILSWLTSFVYILIQEKGLVPKLFDLSGTKNVELQKKLGIQLDNAVPVTCEGKVGV